MLTMHCFPSEYLIHSFSPRAISCAFHDIDGTHSLIRNWMPVMSAVLSDVIERGLPDDFDSTQNCTRLIHATDGIHNPETERFCVESAGLSALTQMEWAIRRAVQEKQIQVDCDLNVNEKKILMIWKGHEIFEELPETPAMEALLSEYTPRLFRLYENVLNGYCRNQNLAGARKAPEKYRVPGSLSFLSYLKEHGVKNYFVTGAVVERNTGIYEEAEVLGYEIGPGALIEDIIGSTWEEKLPKNIIMERLCRKLALSGRHVLVTGDGRAEISTGARMNAVTISRLPAEAARQRELHCALGTNLIVPDFADSLLLRYFL